MEVKTHTLKTWPEFFKAIVEGRKTFEVRKDDGRDFKLGHHLNLVEYDPGHSDNLPNGYTGNYVLVEIVYILRKDILQYLFGEAAELKFMTIMGFKILAHSNINQINKTEE